jgi:hypothetical protein
MRMLNDFHELLPVPAERDLPPGRLEQRKHALLDHVAAETRGRRAGAFRALRLWLLSLVLGTVLVGTTVRGAAPQRLAEVTAAVAAAPAAVAAVAAATPRTPLHRPPVVSVSA